MTARRLHQINEAIDIAIRDKDYTSIRLLSIERAELEKELNMRADINAAKCMIASREIRIRLN